MSVLYSRAFLIGLVGTISNWRKMFYKVHLYWPEATECTHFQLYVGAEVIRPDYSKLGMYELRPAVKKLYELRPKVSEWCVSVTSRVVNPKHDELRPAVSNELYHYGGIKCLVNSLTQLSQLSDVIVLSNHNGNISPE
jgi:hypothetical protein